MVKPIGNIAQGIGRLDGKKRGCMINVGTKALS